MNTVTVLYPMFRHQLKGLAPGVIKIDCFVLFFFDIQFVSFQNK